MDPVIHYCEEACTRCLAAEQDTKRKVLPVAAANGTASLCVAGRFTSPQRRNCDVWTWVQSSRGCSLATACAGLALSGRGGGACAGRAGPGGGPAGGHRALLHRAAPPAPGRP